MTNQNIDTKKLIIFDLDGTLTKSKAVMDSTMAELILRLIAVKKVAIITGGGYLQLQTQFLTMLLGNSDNYTNLYLLPTSGTRMYAWKGGWIEQYAENLTKQEKETAIQALNFALQKINFEKSEKTFGQIIEDRGSQITFSALGQNAPWELKNDWDKSRKIREEIVAIMQSKLPNFEYRIGGATSIDITRLGVNKGYGIRRLEQYLNISPEDILFVGDALYYGGNDYPAKAAGTDCIQVEGPEDTKRLVEGWLA